MNSMEFKVMSMTYRISLPLRCVSLLAFALTLCGFLPRTSAQTRGAIGGIVTDQVGAVLQGAEISVQSPVLKAATNEQGRFYINDLGPGTYNLTITYVGLMPFTTSVTVNAGQTANVDARLRVANQGETVVVTAGRASAEVEAINLERAADNLLQVMPNEIITSLPNANLADALGRLPSVTLERDEGGRQIRAGPQHGATPNQHHRGRRQPALGRTRRPADQVRRHSVQPG